ncbi:MULTISPECIES: hypothetical protein [Photorhabdus]|uniref:Phage protein n=1 Tax=Photorhabdus asymbiotica TaxID=291112 RepID=A0ABX9SNB1_9GAMM|nr:hypothetical protein [Photorhabdus asymbiotica]RKS59528.1 hypothetical protein BDD30_1604 [Photorhabdus asymbiotica]
MSAEQLNKLECQIVALKVVVKSILPTLTTQQKKELSSNVESTFKIATDNHPEYTSDIEQVKTFVRDIVGELE